MGDQINICEACLGADRHLVPVHKLAPLLHEIHFEELKESPGGVCRECRSILKKFYSFKHKAKMAQKTLKLARETSAMVRSNQYTLSEQQSYKCENCGAIFQQSAVLYTHTRLVHKGEQAKKKRDC